MEKQHNRGHDGIGIGCVKLNMELGTLIYLGKGQLQGIRLLSFLDN